MLNVVCMGCVALPHYCLAQASALQVVLQEEVIANDATLTLPVRPRRIHSTRLTAQPQRQHLRHAWLPLVLLQLVRPVMLLLVLLLVLLPLSMLQV